MPEIMSVLQNKELVLSVARRSQREHKGDKVHPIRSSEMIVTRLDGKVNTRRWLEQRQPCWRGREARRAENE